MNLHLYGQVTLTRDEYARYQADADYRTLILARMAVNKAPDFAGMFLLPPSLPPGEFIIRSAETGERLQTIPFP